MNNYRFRILELIRYAEGGMKEHYINLVKGIKDRGMEVTALCYFREDEMEYLRNWGIDVIPFPLNGELNPIQDLNAVRKMINILKEYRADVIHCHGFKAGLIGRIVSWLTGHPCVYTVHNFLPHCSSKIERIGAIWLEKVLVKKTNTIITVSQALRKYETDRLNITGDRVKVVYNGVKLPQLWGNYIDVRRKWGVEDNDILVGTVARLIPTKGIGFLISAIPGILKKYPNVRFMIVGDGPEEQNLKDQARSLGCRGNIIFTGYVENIWHYYNAFDIFILPTLSEGLGISILEAMASGKPVIATSTGGIPEIVEHDINGYLISPADCQEIQRAIIHLISQPEERIRYGEAGYRTVKEKFDNDVMIDNTLSILVSSIKSSKKYLSNKHGEDIITNEAKS